MKKFYIIFIAFAALSVSSCIKQLDTLPLNDYDFTSEAAYKDASSYLMGLSYINAYYNFVSQNDPGNSDLSFDDAGQSELIRQWLVLNDLPTKSQDIGWNNDSYIPDLAAHTWTNADNNALIAVYTRCLKAVALVNEFLLQTTDDRLEARGHTDMAKQVHQYRAEAKFHRAMYYYILLDLFGNPPLALEENIGGELPTQVGRSGLFDWLEGQLKELVADGSDMPAKGAVAYPRPTKDAAWALLARLYLNAQVYTGTPRWADAKAAAQKVIENGYSLHPNYRELFMQDNGQTCSADEFIFAIDYDANNSRSWGGTTTLSSGAFDDTMNKAVSGYLGVTNVEYVSAEVWNGYHINPEFVEENFELSNPSFAGDGSTLGYDPANSDKRLMLYNAGAAAANYLSTDATTGWRCWKWAKIDSKGNVIPRGGEDNVFWKFSSADFAIFRLPEMYYIYAESDARLNGGTTTDATAIGYIKALRDRAGLAAPGASMTVEYILKDKAAEYLWEGQRRQDEIRLGIFDADPNRYVYPILESDRSANPNLKQNTGY